MSKKKKIPWTQIIFFAVMLSAGAICGVLIARYLDMSANESNGMDFLSLAILFIGMYVGIYVQLIIHEAGHLVFGLLTGYKLSSFRIGSLMWLNENGKLSLKRLSIAGTGGQCLMVPPELVDGKIPVVLYNLGGSIFNVVFGIIFMLLYMLCKNIPIIPVLFAMTALFGLVFALANGVPMRLGAVDNDGYNALSLSRRKDALRAFWVQMKTNEQISKGIRIKDMPEEWFEVPDDESMKNSMCATVGVFACSRLMDQHKFDEADALMSHLLSIDSGIVGIHRNLMICDRIYCELIGEKRSDILDSYMTKEQQKFMKSMKKFPSVLRTEYLYALIAEKDTDKANKVKELFEKVVRTYPYKSDIEGERELISIAENTIE